MKDEALLTLDFPLTNHSQEWECTVLTSAVRRSSHAEIWRSHRWLWNALYPELSVKLHTLQSCKDMRDLFQDLHHLFKAIERATRIIHIIFISRCLCYLRYIPVVHTGKWRRLWVFRRLRMQRWAAYRLFHQSINPYIKLQYRMMSAFVLLHRG